MKDKVLLTGASGLVGSFILEWLVSENIDVKALYRASSDKTLMEKYGDKVEWFEADMLDFPSIEIAFEGCNKIIHSAAVVSYAPKDQETMIEINVTGTKNLIDLALENNIEHFIHISSIAAIGRPKLIFELDEDVDWEDNPNNSTYAKSKYQSEIEVWRGIAEGLKAVILNPSFVLGPGDWKRSSTQLFRYIWNENIFYTEGNLNFVDVRDVVAAIKNCFKNTITNERYIISAGSIRYKELFEFIAKRWDKRKPFIKVNSLISEFAWRFEAIRSFLTGSTPFITKESAKSSKKTHVFNSGKSQNKLNIQYRSLEETLDWVCPILKNKYK